jgi:hypothetical protein
MNVRDYSTLHLDSNEKQVATFVLLLHEHLILWNQYSVILVFIMSMSHNMHSVVRHYRIARLSFTSVSFLTTRCSFTLICV